MGHDANENLAVQFRVDWASQPALQRRERLSRTAAVTAENMLSGTPSGCGGGAQCTGLSWRNWCSEDGDKFVVLILGNTHQVKSC